MTYRLWLYNPETKGFFECPLDAVDAWKARGWHESEPPQEVNPAVVEWQPHAVPAEVLAAVMAEDQAEPKTSTRKPRGAAAENTTEGVNDVG